MRKAGESSEVVPGIYAVHWKFSMCTATSIVRANAFVILLNAFGT